MLRGNKGKTLRYTATKRAEVSSMSFFYGASSMSTFLSPYQIGGTPGFSDNFDDDSVDASLWTVRQTNGFSDTPNLTIAVAEIGSVLQMTSGGDHAAGCEAGFVSTELYNFTGQQASVELVQHDVGFGLGSCVALNLDLSNRARFGVEGVTNRLLVMEFVAGSFNSRKFTNYSNVAHRWLRIRSTPGALVYEFSADGITWTIFYTGPPPFALTALRIFLHQVTGASGVTAGKFTKFDNFVMTAGSGGIVITPANVVGGTLANLIFTKTAADATWGNSGFSSAESIAGDGSIEWIATGTTTSKMIGLSTVDTDQNFTSIQYAWFMSDSGAHAIYESGAATAIAGSYVANTTVFKIERVGTTLTYYKDNVSMRVVAGVTTAPLFVDTSAYTASTTIGPIHMVQ